ncbi:hypothetical protein Q765_15010 [Flavobacterium rivuli WB 3.3-2 = DSM 21788]|uniref:PKD domain-containing protein n=1 Tax=Flavobacterium rivuli WB 3.3-2 = DSM 21788 TaxID=1121895 RepID=A0A0A2M2B4_9FLAO|nr:hypothetical protein [Flavobacterium rivuli]KGO85726.1 hypothetical protein Q765_15010 [Flavobacterium rivuli WB 3.3-2 = DSM 21788]
MIQQLKNIPPNIDFGFGITKQEVAVNTPVTVWLNTLYNQDVYGFTLHATGVVTKISNYEYVVTYPLPGTYTLTLGVGTKDKKISLDSNILTLIVT